jgi:hypothetical protein
MKDTLATHANNSARPADALPNFVPNKHLAFMNEWTRERKITGGKRVPKEPSQWSLDDCPAFLLMNHDRDGKERPDLSRTRYDTSHPTCPKDEHGKPQKYKLDGAPGFSPIFAPLPDSYAKFAAAKVKWIAEGEGGTLALAQLGLPVLGIGGCQNWRTKGTEDLSPYLDGIKRGDTVNIAGDGDVRTNMQVREGYGGLMYAIRMRGAIPIYRLPDEAAGEKAGIDDVLARSENPLTTLDRLRSLTDLRSLDNFKFTTYEELLAREPPEWIVDGLIQPGEVTVIYGLPKCGKSFVTQDLLAAIARKEPTWFGKEVNTFGLVVHITLEGKGLSARMQAYAKAHALTEPMPYLCLEQSIAIPNEEDTDRLIRSIKHEALKAGLPVILVAIDTVNRALGGGDENDSKDMGSFIRQVDRIRDSCPKAGIILVHHQGKDAAKGLRGHSSLLGAIGCSIHIEKKPNNIHIATIVDMRDGPADGQFTFGLDTIIVGKTRKDMDITSCVVNFNKDAKGETSDTYIFKQICFWNLNENKGRLTSYEQLRLNRTRILGKDTKIKVAEFNAAIEGAINQGLITKTKLARNGYSLEIHAPKDSPKLKNYDPDFHAGK